MFDSLPSVCFTKTDNSESTLYGREAQNMQTTIQIANGNKPDFRICLARIGNDNRIFPIKITRPIKRQGSQSGVLFALYRVKFDFHGLIVTTIKQIVKDKYAMTSFPESSILRDWFDKLTMHGCRSS
jgi:hypothetical protein